MPSSDDLEFKQIILERKLVTPQQMEECLQELDNYEKAGIPKPLAGVLLDKDLVGQDQVNGIYKLLNKGDMHYVRGYTILQTLGQGGLGVVYKARRDNTGMLVALKIMYPNFVSNKEFVRRFMKEAKFSCQLNHNNIVKGIDFGESNNIFYFAMEYVEGVTLKEYIKSRGKVEEKEAAALILQIANGLKQIENHNLIHRDIKPDNIMIANEDGVAKLCDLGLAKCMEDSLELTAPGVVMGTPHYMSPEQGMAGGVIDIRSDIYALGVTFFHMVSGEVPYQGNTAVSILNQHVSADVPSPKMLESKISDNICNIIIKMMSKKQEDRYQSTQDLIVDLNRYIQEKEPLLASNYSLLNATPNLEEKDITQQRTIAMTASKNTQEEEYMDTKISSPVEQAVSNSIKENISEKNTPIRNTPEENVPKKNIKGKSSAQHWENIANSEKKKKKKSRKLAVFTFFVLLPLGIVSYLSKGEIISYLEREYFGKKGTLTENDIKSAENEEKHLSVEEFLKKEQLGHEEKYKKLIAEEHDIKSLTQNMVKMPSGKLTTNEGEVEIAEFWMDKYEVSNKDYLEFCQATKHRYPKNWKDTEPSANEYDFPVTNISWYDATLYAAWKGKRLPTEHEWQYAAGSLKTFSYPWGNEYQKNMANIKSSSIKKINDFEKGRTSNGILNMAGNVWEWTDTLFGQENKEEKDRVIKGGSYLYGEKEAMSSYKDGFHPLAARDDIGFRCAVSPSK